MIQEDRRKEGGDRLKKLRNRMPRSVRKIVSVLAVVLPQYLKRAVYNHVFGWCIDPDCAIGFSYLDAEFIEMKQNSRIGHLNVLRGLREAHIEPHGRIGQWNWISASSEIISSKDEQLNHERGVLRVHLHAAITNRHYIDCSGGFSLGRFSTIGGVKSTIMSHQIDTSALRNSSAPVHVGDYCAVSSDVRIVPGVSIPDRCRIAMGAVVAASLPESDTLYGGVPAKPLKRIGDDPWFSRIRGYVPADTSDL